MSKYRVTITYAGFVLDPEQIVAPICRIFEPNNSYIDTPVYTQGGPLGEGAQKVYGKSIYATNVADKGYGDAVLPEPYASTSIPFPVSLAQFKLAVVGKDNKVVFEARDYRDAFFYAQVGEQMKSQGFNVKVQELNDQGKIVGLKVAGVEVFAEGDDKAIVNPKENAKLSANVLLNDGTVITAAENDPDVTYDWKKDAETVGTDSTYTVVQSTGDSLSVTVTYAKAEGSAEWKGTVEAAG